MNFETQCRVFGRIHQPVHRPHLQTEALAPGSEAPKGAITLGLDPAIGNREGYVLTVKADRVTLNGQTENGVFYGIQTLRKSIPAKPSHLYPIACRQHPG